MATDKPRLSISMDEETFEKVIAYKEEKGIATQSKAIIKIMEMGLDKLEKEILQKKSLSTESTAPRDTLSDMFDSLLSSLISMGLVKPGQDITDRQAEVLTAVCRILRATFQ